MGGVSTFDGCRAGPATPYASRSSLCLEDFAELTFVAPHLSLVPPSTEETFQPFRTPSGRLIAHGPVVTSWDDQLKAVSAGHAVIGCPAEAARFHPWPDLTCVPVHDAPQSRRAFAWRTAGANPLIRAFVDAVDMGHA